MSKIIFLDFDGVIRIATQGHKLTPDPAEFVDILIQRVAAICHATDAKIVVSSDWRNFEPLDVIKEHLTPALAQYLHDDWKTETFGKRYNEIATWLIHHQEVTNYIILDDFAQHFEGCSTEMRFHLVLTSNRYGIQPTDQQTATIFLKQSLKPKT